MSISLQFLGAAGGVTGSSYLIKTNKTSFLIDCGLFQGQYSNEQKNWQPFAFNAKKLDFVILTHAHLDHCGLIPKLYKHGFRGKIYSTPATFDIAQAILINAAHIQEHGATDKQLESLFLPKDAEGSFQLFKTYPYNQIFEVDTNIKIRSQDAGHILGAAIVEIWIEGKKIVFSGDLGNSPVPIMKDPAIVKEADYIICESTYGNRNHEPIDNRKNKLLKAIKFAQIHRSKIIIPSFSLERAQDLLYTFNELKNNGLLDKMPVILDSPLASQITKIFKKYTDQFDDEFQKQLQIDPDLFSFKGFKETIKREESKQLNHLTGAAIIIAGSGMADAGRVRHHILHAIDNPKNQILFIGFQVPGTLGNKLVAGNKRVRILNYTRQVNAKIINIESFSAHADQRGLLFWLSNFSKQPAVFITHGENPARVALSQKINKQLKFKTYIPRFKQKFIL